MHRAQGRHGDRGTFEYYLRQLGAGFFPWSGVAVAAGVQIGRWLRADHEQDSARRQLILLCFVWFVVDFTIVTVVNTKFHHYILPAPCRLWLPSVACSSMSSAPSVSVVRRPAVWRCGRWPAR